MLSVQGTDPTYPNPVLTGDDDTVTPAPTYPNPVLTGDDDTVTPAPTYPNPVLTGDDDTVTEPATGAEPTEPATGAEPTYVTRTTCAKCGGPTVDPVLTGDDDVISSPDAYEPVPIGLLASDLPFSILAARYLEDATFLETRANAIRRFMAKLSFNRNQIAFADFCLLDPRNVYYCAQSLILSQF